MPEVLRTFTPSIAYSMVCVQNTLFSFLSPCALVSACFLFSHRLSLPLTISYSIPTPQLATPTPSYRSHTPTYNGFYHAFVIYIWLPVPDIYLPSWQHTSQLKNNVALSFVYTGLEKLCHSLNDVLLCPHGPLI